MWRDVLKHWQISGAVVFSILLVTGSYLLTKGVISPAVAQASEETALLQAVATKDSDSDGLPDWQEALYGTDPHVADSFHLGMSDGEAVARGLIVPKADAEVGTSSSATDGSDIVDPSLPPAPAENTLTAQFAQLFFNNYLAARQNNDGEDLSESQLNDLANQTVASLTSTLKAAPDFKTKADLTIIPATPDAMLTFGKAAEAVMTKNTNDATTTDLNYLKSGVTSGDTTAYDKIRSMAKSFSGSAAGLAALPVPENLADADLMLINALMRMSGIDTDFAKVESDPLVTILALQQYQSVATALGQSFISIGKIYAASKVSVPAGAPGALFVNVIANIEAMQGNRATQPKP
jgi:hypothetical protein